MWSDSMASSLLVPRQRFVGHVLARRIVHTRSHVQRRLLREDWCHWHKHDGVADWICGRLVAMADLWRQISAGELNITRIVAVILIHAGD
jgi:hypothetical protein